MELRFCPQCASPLTDRFEAGRTRRVCPKEGCGFIHYGNPLPVVAAIVEHEGAVVLVRAPEWPEKLFGLVTGFLEAGESPEQGVLRELKEELGLEGEIVSLVGVYPFEMRNELIVAFHVRATGTLVLGDELAAFKRVLPGKLRAWEFGTGLAVRDWLRTRSEAATSRPMIKIGDRVPEAKLWESTEFGKSCPRWPKPVSVAEASKGKRIVVFALPGAFTPTCSERHLPGYLEHHDALRARKVDEVWCVSVNDGYVMAEWGKSQQALGKIRMLGDGSAEWSLKLGLQDDLTADGMGMRCQRYSMLLEDGVVKQLNVEAPDKFEVSDAATMLKQLA